MRQKTSTKKLQTLWWENMEKDQNEKGFQGSESEEYNENCNSKIYLQFQ